MAVRGKICRRIQTHKPKTESENERERETEHVKSEQSYLNPEENYKASNKL